MGAVLFGDVDAIREGWLCPIEAKRVVVAGLDMSVDRIQNITASFVTRPSLKGNVLVRVMFQRIVYNDRNEVSRAEALDDPELYLQFFSKLQKAVFLHAHEL